MSKKTGSVSDQWESTKHGGFRRRGVAQIESATQMKWKSVSRIHPPRPFKVAFRERLGLPSCPYVIRWRFETPWFSIRLHHWLAPDDDRAVHDHPWAFRTFVLKGGYIDHSPSGDTHLRAPATAFREATHQHTVFPDPGGCWTVIVTGPQVRRWGFWVKGKFIRSYRYFYRYGHHPCD